MTDTDKTFVSILLDVLSERGVTDVVCSPGSRNAPLLIGIAARKEFRKHFSVDERSGAFQALGLALVSKKPVALICTSGTALLNYAPAVAEAYYQGVPLIVISADRPIQWIDQDDSQTLRQNEALANFVKRSYNLPCEGEDNRELQWYTNRIANDAILYACSGKPGPVHINVALGEPLGRKKDRSATQPRLIRQIEADSIGNKETVKDLAKTLSECRVMLVAGFMMPDSRLQKAFVALASFPNITVFAETLSNLHLPEEDYSVDSTLTALEEKDLERLAPDIVISIGGAVVSRKLKEYLRKYSATTQHWAVGVSHLTSDPFMALSLKIEVMPARFFSNLAAAMRKLKIGEKVTSYKADWKESRLKAISAKQNFINSQGWSELQIFSEILRNLPSGCNLFLSNGTAVRYAQLTPHKLPHATYCNRGVSGIEGSVSTAIGGAKAYKGCSMIITGDLSMLYDCGSLAIEGIPENFKIIVVDNQGGGIFRFIPSTSALEEREDYFCMPPNLPLKQMAEGFGWIYFEAEDEASFRKNYKRLLDSRQKAILRIRCDGRMSAEILKNYMEIK